LPPRSISRPRSALSRDELAGNLRALSSDFYRATYRISPATARSAIATQALCRVRGWRAPRSRRLLPPRRIQRARQVTRAPCPRA
jgi:hypothetical protein